MANLGPGKDKPTDETQEDGSNTAEGDGSIEENETADGDRELVEGADHGVGCRGGDTNAPGRAVRDEDGGQTGVHHSNHELVLGLLGEVAGKVLRRPILKQQGEDNQDGDGKEVVVEHGYWASVYCTLIVVVSPETYCHNP